MKKINKKIQQQGALIVFSVLFSIFNTVSAESDMQLMEKALKAREIKNHKKIDHSNHKQEGEETKFRGVFYGYLPCDQKDCDGIKMTLSLKQKNNYLLVTQYAKSSTREYYEKGKYDWDEKNSILTLNPKKKGEKRLFNIRDEANLILLNNDGSLIKKGKEKDYTLQRSDAAKTREVHIH